MSGSILLFFAKLHTLFVHQKKYLTYFVSGQVLLQILNLFSGFFLLRWLSIEEQAKFSIAFSVQTLIVTLSDFGLTNSVMALAGEQYNNNRVLAKYIYTIKRMRIFLLAGALFVAAVLMPFFINNQSWHYTELLLLLLPVMAAAFWQIDMGLYTAPLALHKKMKEFYQPQIVLTVLKLFGTFCLYLAGWINAFWVLLMNALILLWNGKRFYFFGKPFLLDESGTAFQFSEQEYRETRTEVLRYIKPLAVGILFNAFYNQLQIFIIAYFGKTQNIAEVAALGRLGQVYMFLNAFASVIVSPFISKATMANLFKKYILVLLLSVSAALSLFFMAWFFPNAFLWLLGSKYSHLEKELPYMMLNASIGFVGTIFFVMHSARKWIFWKMTWLYIITIVSSQIAGACIFNIATTLGVLKMSLLTTVSMLIVHFSTLALGIKHEASK